MVGREGWLVAGVHDEIMRLNVERTMESRVSEETHFGLKNGDEGRYLDFGRLRGGWFTLPRVWRLSADKPKTSDPTNLQTCINEMKEPILRRRYLFLSLSVPAFTLFPQPSKLEISVDLCLDRARIKRNSRVSRTQCFHLVCVE